jgi:hypothetical protein
MKTVRTEIIINAPPQTVWSILDDLDRYPEWNRVLPTAKGRTTVGQLLDASVAFPGMPEPQPFAPELLRIVGVRELRWVTTMGGDQGYRAEHWFILTPLGGGMTHLKHCESFEGPAIEFIWPMMDTTGRQAYEEMNQSLKARAEAAVDDCPSLHPTMDAGGAPGAADDRTGTLRCLCKESPVEVEVTGAAQHNHLCGCSKC